MPRFMATEDWGLNLHSTIWAQCKELEYQAV